MEKVMNTNSDLMRVIQNITFKNSVLDVKLAFDFCEINVDDYSFERKLGKKRGWFIWATFERLDAITGKISRVRGREEVVWRNATESSVVKTCRLLVELMIGRELMEGFSYKNIGIQDEA